MKYIFLLLASQFSHCSGDIKKIKNLKYLKYLRARATDFHFTVPADAGGDVISQIFRGNKETRKHKTADGTLRKTQDSGEHFRICIVFPLRRVVQNHFGSYFGTFHAVPAHPLRSRASRGILPPVGTIGNTSCLIHANYVCGRSVCGQQILYNNIISC